MRLYKPSPVAGAKGEQRNEVAAPRGTNQVSGRKSALRKRKAAPMQYVILRSHCGHQRVPRYGKWVGRRPTSASHKSLLPKRDLAAKVNRLFTPTELRKGQREGQRRTTTSGKTAKAARTAALTKGTDVERLTKIQLRRRTNLGHRERRVLPVHLMSPWGRPCRRWSDELTLARAARTRHVLSVCLLACLLACLHGASKHRYHGATFEV